MVHLLRLAMPNDQRVRDALADVFAEASTSIAQPYSRTDS